jgi:hypothetical protein
MTGLAVHENAHLLPWVLGWLTGVRMHGMEKLSAFPNLFLLYLEMEALLPDDRQEVETL